MTEEKQKNLQETAVMKNLSKVKSFITNEQTSTVEEIEKICYSFYPLHCTVFKNAKICRQQSLSLSVTTDK